MKNNQHIRFTIICAGIPLGDALNLLKWMHISVAEVLNPKSRIA